MDTNTINGFYGDDTIYGNAGYGNAGDDVIYGSVGADHINGGSGIDTERYNSTYVGLIVNLTSGKGQYGDAQGDVLVSIENVVGSEANDQLTGNTVDNGLWG